MKKQSLIKGTIILGLGGIIAKFLGLFFRWPLQMLIGDEGVGYYQMSFPLYMFFIAAASGIPVAISKMVSERNAVGDKEGVILVLRKAMLFMVIVGVGFTAILLIFARPLIHFLKWDDKSYYSLLGIALAPIFISVMSALRGFFQGLQNMNYSAMSQIIEQLGRVIVGVGLAFILVKYGIEYAAGGAAIGAAAGGLFGGVYLIHAYYKFRKKFKIKKIKDDSKVMSSLLYIAIPVSLGAAAGTVMNLIDSVLVPQKLLLAGYTYKASTILYGQLTGKAYILINLPLTLSVALCASLVPIIAEAFILRKRFEVISKVEMAIKVSMVIAIPSFLGLFFMAHPVLDLLFPGQSEGYNILKYLSICIPFIVLSQTSTAILQGIGRYSTPVISIIVGCFVKVLITSALVTIPSINIYGAVIGTIAGYLTACVMNMIFLKKYLHISINYYNVMIKPAFAAVLMIISVVIIYMYVYNYTISSRISCLFSIMSGVVIYGILVFAFGIFDFNNIKTRFVNR